MNALPKQRIADSALVSTSPRLIQTQRRSPYSGRSASSPPRGWALLAPAIALAELTFVPDETDVVEVLGDRLGRQHPPHVRWISSRLALAPRTPSCMWSGERTGADVIVGEGGGHWPPGGQVEAFEESFAVHTLLRSVSLPSSGR